MDLITVTRKQGLEFAVGLRDHELTTDMAPAEGGHDAGVNPVEPRLLRGIVHRHHAASLLRRAWLYGR